MDRAKILWLESIGAKEYPEPVKYTYIFPGFEGSFNLSERYINETPLEELKARYEKNYAFAKEAIELRKLKELNHREKSHE